MVRDGAGGNRLAGRQAIALGAAAAITQHQCHPETRRGAPACPWYTSKANHSRSSLTTKRATACASAPACPWCASSARCGRCRRSARGCPRWERTRSVSPAVLVGQGTGLMHCLGNAPGEALWTGAGWHDQRDSSRTKVPTGPTPAHPIPPRQLALKERTTRTGRPLVHDSFSALFMLSKVCTRNGAERMKCEAAVMVG